MEEIPSAFVSMWPIIGKFIQKLKQFNEIVWVFFKILTFHLQNPIIDWKSFMFKKIMKSYDYSIVAVYILLCLFGLIMIYSSSMVDGCAHI